MANEVKEKTVSESTFFVLVPKVGAPVPNYEVLVSQTMKKVENGVMIQPEKSDVISPNGQGLFEVKKSHPNYKARVKALEQVMKDENHEGAPPFLIGPFDTAGEAFTKMDKVRPKTDSETAAREKARGDKLEAEMQAKNDELAELKAKLAEAQKKQSPGSN